MRSSKTLMMAPNKTPGSAETLLRKERLDGLIGNVIVPCLGDHCRTGLGPSRFVHQGKLNAIDEISRLCVQG